MTGLRARSPVFMATEIMPTTKMAKTREGWGGKGELSFVVLKEQPCSVVLNNICFIGPEKHLWGVVYEVIIVTIMNKVQC